MSQQNPFAAESTLSTAAGDVKIYRLEKLADDGLGDIATLPYSIRVLLESCLRNCDGYVVSEDDVRNIAGWQAQQLIQRYRANIGLGRGLGAGQAGDTREG